MKTGYCHIYNHRMPLDSITDRLHIGNRWLGHLGLAMYDNTARVHDPVMPWMLTCDNRAVDYPGHSPFSHCAGNPANMMDFDGNDVTVLDGGLHIALLVQQKNGRYAYYSINGDNVYIGDEFSGGKTFNNVGERSFESPQAFLDSDYNTSGGDKTRDDVNGYGYERGYSISCTSEQDKAIMDKFIEAAQTEYSISSNNCATIVQEALQAGGIRVRSVGEASVKSKGAAYMLRLLDSERDFEAAEYISHKQPGAVFENIRLANPNGEMITKTNN